MYRQRLETQLIQRSPVIPVDATWRERALNRPVARMFQRGLLNVHAGRKSLPAVYDWKRRKTMTVEEQKTQAKREKEVMVRIMLNCYPKFFGDPYKARDELLKKTYCQLKKLYEKTMNEKWVYDLESPWMR